MHSCNLREKELRKILLTFLSATLLVSCSDGGTFSGGSQKAEREPIEEVEKSSVDVKEEVKTEAEEVIADDISNKVSKGIFTVWSEPSSPREKESYYIYIKSSVEVMPSDMSGSITGTDGFFDQFGGYSPAGENMFSSEGTLIRFYVPGALAKVKDTIKVAVVEYNPHTRSYTPKENMSETLELYFSK